MPLSIENPLSIPLLSKELAEQANRRRTYAIRLLVAVSMILLSAIYVDVLTIDFDNPLRHLGQGRDLLLALLNLAFVSIYIVVPAVSCGVITSEKERNTLGNLLITRLTPSTIILEKFLGVVIPFLLTLLPAAPLIAVAYVLGGLGPTELMYGIWCIRLELVLTASIGIFCSCSLSTTALSYVATMVWNIAIRSTPIFISVLIPGLDFPLCL